MPTVKLFANLRKIAGTNEIAVSGANLRAVLNELVRSCPALDGVILGDGQLRRYFIITINGNNATDLETTVAEGDLIAIFPPIAGGSCSARSSKI
jgi:molybdopterin synthase sulfur carrier subunit